MGARYNDTQTREYEVTMFDVVVPAPGIVGTVFAPSGFPR